MQVPASLPMFSLVLRTHHVPLRSRSLYLARRWRVCAQLCCDAHVWGLSEGSGTGQIHQHRLLQKTFSSAPSGCVAESILPCVYNQPPNFGFPVHCQVWQCNLCECYSILKLFCTENNFPPNRLKCFDLILMIHHYYLIVLFNNDGQGQNARFLFDAE